MKDLGNYLGLSFSLPVNFRDWIWYKEHVRATTPYLNKGIIMIDSILKAIQNTIKGLVDAITSTTIFLGGVAKMLTDAVIVTLTMLTVSVGGVIKALVSAIFLTLRTIIEAPLMVYRWIKAQGGSWREYWVFAVRSAMFVGVVTVPLALIEKYFGGNTVVQKVARAVLEQFVWSGIEYVLFRWFMSEMEKAQRHAHNDPYYTGFTYQQAS